MRDQDTQRWDGDERGTGTHDGSAGADGPRRLAAEMATPGWITEDPDLHLLPNLREACLAPDAPWTIDATAAGDGGVYRISLTWTRPAGSMRTLRADLFALVGAIAEHQTFVAQAIEGDAVVYRVSTGMLPGEGGFSGHGHLLALRVTGPRIPALIAGTRPPQGHPVMG